MLGSLVNPFLWFVNRDLSCCFSVSSSDALFRLTFVLDYSSAWLSPYWFLLWLLFCELNWSHSEITRVAETKSIVTKSKDRWCRGPNSRVDNVSDSYARDWDSNLTVFRTFCVKNILNVTPPSNWKLYAIALFQLISASVSICIFYLKGLWLGYIKKKLDTD